MTRLITVILISALLGGCIVVPLDHGHRGGGHRHGHYWDNHHPGEGAYRHWRYEERR